MHGRNIKELLLKEAYAEEYFNHDRGLELPDCWMITLRRLEGGANLGRPLTFRDVH